MIRDSNLIDNTNGIRIDGDGNTTANTDVNGTKQGIGIQIDGDDNNIGPANKIHDNNTGVKIANGSGNFVERNIIYKNDANGDGEYKQTEGIFLADGANNNILPPALLNITGTLVSKADVEVG